MNDLVSVIVTTRDRKEIVKNCINSIKNSTYRNIEIIVVDDSSSDGTTEYLSKEFGDSIKIVSLKQRGMLVKARNAGISKGNGDFFLFLDDDNIIHENMIEHLVNCAKLDKKYGIIGTIMYIGDETNLALTRQRVSLWTGKTKSFKKIVSEIKESDGTPNVFLVKREVFDTVGTFDEDFVATYTEPAFSFEAKKFGFKTIVCQNARTIHMLPHGKISGRLIGGAFKHTAYILIRSRFVLIKKYGKLYHWIFFTILFSWIAPVIYTILALSTKRNDLIKLYWVGFIDGLMYMFTNNLRTSVEYIKCLDNNKHRDESR